MERRRLIFFGSIIVLIIISGSCQSEKGKSAGESVRKRQTPKIDAWVVQPDTLVNQITVSGSLLPYEEVELKNEVAGRVVQLNLPEGKFVKAGTLLVKIFDDDLQANLRKLSAQLEIQKQILARQGELLKVSGISQTDYDQTLTTVSSIQAEIDVVKAQIRKTEILAPFDGTIGLRAVSPGAILTSSTLLATIRQENRLKLDFSVPEKYGSLIEPGLSIGFSLQGDQTIYSATVMATEQSIETSTRSLKVRAVIDHPEKKLIAGAYANVSLSLGEETDALLVPTNAIIPQQKGKSIIVAREGKAHFVEVETGIRTSSAIQIIRGIEAGDTIIISGVLFLKEGMKLDYASIKSNAL